MSVHAVLIGIERYDCEQDGINLALDGPASDAVRFALWFLERDVPPGNIHLFINALDMPARIAELQRHEKGHLIDIHEPVRDEIEYFFTNQIPNLDGGTIYVLWGGHGVMRDGLERHLFYANMRKDQPLTFELDRWLAKLRRHQNFPHQNIFVDACANYVELTQFKGLSPTQLVLDQKIAFVEQHVLCAAASGEKTPNDKVRRTGLFSEALLNLLNERKNWLSGWDLAPALEADYIRRAKSDPNYRLRPVWLRFVADDGSTIDRGSVPFGPKSQRVVADLAGCSMSQVQRLSAVMVEALADLPALRARLHTLILGLPNENLRGDPAEDCAALAAWTLVKDKISELKSELIDQGVSKAVRIANELLRVRRTIEAHELLKKLTITSDQYKAIYRRIEVDETRPELLDEMLDVLVDRGPLDRCNLLRFILEVAEIVPEVQRQPLRNWVHDNADANFEANIVSALQESRTYRILLGLSDARKIAWGRRLCNGVLEPVKFEQPVPDEAALLPALECLYEDLVKGIEANRIVTVEVILGLSHLHLDVESTGIPLKGGLPKQPLCQKLPLALRWKERIMEGVAYHKDEWIFAGRKISKLANPAKLYRLAEPVKEDHWQLEPPGHVLDLNFVPADDDGATLALTIFHGGVPFACWHRSQPAGTYPQVLEDFAGGVERFEELPRKLPSERRERPELRTMALFWDDPETDPVDLIKSYEELL